MFDQLASVSPDPILQTLLAYRADHRKDKIDLGVGIYRNENGETPVFSSVKKAEALLLQREDTKAYLGPLGSTDFNQAISELALGPYASRCQERLAVIQTPGGCGALRVGAELIHRSQPQSRLWLSSPTWGNHRPLLGRVGFPLEEYRYLQQSDEKGVRIFLSSGLDFDGLKEDLQQASPKDVVLLHASCHNPSGEDLTRAQWTEVVELCQRKDLIPFVDMAYQGFGQSLEEDIAGLVSLFSRCKTAVLAVSCSKNFGLYRERTGALIVQSVNVDTARRVSEHLQQIVRGLYSMPPSHGAAVVTQILSDQRLRGEWVGELSACRKRIQSTRSQFANGLRSQCGERFDFLEKQNGMFSLLGLSVEQVRALRKDFAVYLTEDSRLSLAGINTGNIDRLIGAIASIV